jgi:predicted regulator of Ras-like GTPase activity (Roadblock/LC7/MglB family)
VSGRFGPALEALTRHRGVRGAMVVEAEDGLVVAESLMGEIKGPALAALAANLAGHAGELALRAGLGVPRFMHLQAAEGALLVAPAPPEMVLVAVAGRDVPLGLLRLEMLRMAERLG